MRKQKCLVILLLVSLLLCHVAVASADVWDLSTCTPNAAGEIVLAVSDGDTITGNAKHHVVAEMENTGTLVFRDMHIKGSFTLNGNQNVTLKLEGSSSADHPEYGCESAYFNVPVLTVVGNGTLHTSIIAGELVLNSGTIVSDEEDLWSQLFLDKLTINGGTLNVCPADGRGIFAYGDVVINGGNVTAMGSVCGIETDSHIRVHGGYLLAAGLRPSDGFQMTGGTLKTYEIDGILPGSAFRLPEYFDAYSGGERLKAWEIYENRYYRIEGNINQGIADTQNWGSVRIGEAPAGEYYVFPEFKPTVEGHVSSTYSIYPIFEEVPDLPQTGDGFRMELWLVLTLISAAGLIGFASRKRQHC